MPTARQSSEAAGPWPRARRGRSRARRRPRACAARPRKAMPNARTKQAADKRRAERQHGADGRHQQLEDPLRQRGAEQHGLERQPLRDEAVERRQRGDGETAAEEQECGLRHAVDEAAELLDVAFAGGGEHGAGAEEQQALEQRVVEGVQQRGGERERGGGGHAVGLEGQREPEADEDDADILDGAEGEQPLQVALHEGAEHAEHGGGAADGEQDAAPPPAGRPSRSNTTRTKP